MDFASARVDRHRGARTRYWQGDSDYSLNVVLLGVLFAQAVRTTFGFHKFSCTATNGSFCANETDNARWSNNSLEQLGQVITSLGL